MNTGDFTNWLQRAFLLVEAALASELATPSRTCMSEDYLRISFVRGLSHSEPSQAHRICTESHAPWTERSCWHDATHGNIGQRRPIQHDVAVVKDHNDSGMICEVKWLKQAKAKELAQDIWKLALTRGIDSEAQAVRTYLLVGGEGNAMSDTFRTLQNNHINIRWSNAGRTAGIPSPRNVSLYSFMQTALGIASLDSLLKWSKHHRHPPDTWRVLRLTVRQVWYRTIDTVKWRMCLFEFTHRGTDSNATMPWDVVRQSSITRAC